MRRSSPPAGRGRRVMGGYTVAELGRGQHVGVMSLVDRSVRSLSAVATGADGARLVAIQRKDFYDIIKREPASAVKMLWAFVQVLGQRLRKTTNDLSDALHGDKHGEETEQENLFQDCLARTPVRAGSRRMRQRTAPAHGDPDL